MTGYSIIWDLETILDCDAFKRVEAQLELSDDEARKQHGDKFAKLPLHQIVCIGALVAERNEDGFRVVALERRTPVKERNGRSLRHSSLALVSCGRSSSASTATASICPSCVTGRCFTAFQLPA